MQSPCHIEFHFFELSPLCRRHITSIFTYLPIFISAQLSYRSLYNHWCVQNFVKKAKFYPPHPSLPPTPSVCTFTLSLFPSLSSCPSRGSGAEPQWTESGGVTPDKCCAIWCILYTNLWLCHRRGHGSPLPCINFATLYNRFLAASLSQLF